jgi:hypothetical protein
MLQEMTSGELELTTHGLATFLDVVLNRV